MATKCAACGQILEGDRKICLRCGAWYGEFGRGLAGQPLRVLVLRRFGVLLWLLWVLAAVASFTQSYVAVIIAGLLFVPLGIVMFLLAVRAYEKGGALIALASTYLWILLLFVEASLDGSTSEGAGAMAISSMSVLLLGWPAYRLYRYPVIASHPWCCTRCGYILIGLDGHRCPECGERFNPVRVEKSIPPHRRRQFALPETAAEKKSTPSCTEA